MKLYFQIIIIILFIININKPITVIKFNEKNIVDTIGEGGSAVVYKYIDNNKLYACKKKKNILSIGRNRDYEKI